ncbi:MAG: PorT family protein [Bdellovibrionaceae bacterium]|nr:PorT family protein [Bdellovibrionales bacterium]MCB9253807.1 PorT family protein [Pseudobdellovibrionaceae bacterium]
MKVLLSFLLVLLISACGHRHDYRSLYHPVGFQGGINFASARVNDTQLDKQQRYMFGQNMEFELNDYFAVRQETWFAQKGASVANGVNVLGSTVSGTQTFSPDYIEVDALLKLRFDYWGLKPYVLGGPYLAIKEKSRTSSGAPAADFAALDFGASIGAGFEIDLANSVAISIGGRYSLGLTNAIRATDRWTTQGIQILLGFEFNLRPDRRSMKAARRYVRHYQEFKDLDEYDLK